MFYFKHSLIILCNEDCSPWWSWYSFYQKSKENIKIFLCDSCHTAVIQSAAVLCYRKSWLCSYGDSHREQKITCMLITRSSHTTCHFPCSTRHFHHVGFLWIWNIWWQLISVCSQMNVPFVAQWSEASHGHVKHSAVALYRKTSVPYSVKCVGEQQGPRCRSVIVLRWYCHH